MLGSVALTNATWRTVPKTVSRHAKLSSNLHTVASKDSHKLQSNRFIIANRDRRRFPLVQLTNREDIDNFLSKYSEVDLHRQLQPKSDVKDETPDQVTADDVHHIQRLSALRTSKDPKTTEELRQVLEKQLSFVRIIQDIDVSDVEPLVSLGEIALDAQRETRATLESLQHVFDKEERVGRYGRIVPKKAAVDRGSSPEHSPLDWDPLKIAPETSGAFIKVPAKATNATDARSADSDISVEREA